jgi:cytoskeleton protein RodZ
MGELPADLHAKSSSARWAIPLALVAIVGIAAVYEWSRPNPGTTRASPESKAPTAVAPSTTLSPATPAPESAPVTPVPATAPFPVDNSKANVVDSGNATAAVAPSSAPLILVFRGSSWVEIKDSKGAVLLSTMGFPGATHAVGGAPPFDVVIGNAEAVTVTVRGEAFDVGPHIRQNVAKFTVK